MLPGRQRFINTRWAVMCILTKMAVPSISRPILNVKITILPCASPACDHALQEVTVLTDAIELAIKEMGPQHFAMRGSEPMQLTSNLRYVAEADCNGICPDCALKQRLKQSVSVVTRRLADSAKHQAKLDAGCRNKEKYQWCQNTFGSVASPE